MIKIFIVDDDKSLQRLYSLILKENGFDIIDIAINGKDAIEKYKKLNIKPDLILLDHRMPIKNGLDTMVEILEMNKKEKIIFASADMTVRQKALSLGACGFLNKPFKIQELVITIQNIAKELCIEK